MYTTFEIENGNLKIELTTEGHEEFEALLETKKTDEQILLDLIEYQLCNGYSLVKPENIGALTDSLIIADEIIDEETTPEDVEATNVYWFPSYQVQSYVDGFLRNGYVIFIKA